MSDIRRMSRTIDEIRTRLKSKKLQQKHLAEASGITQSAVSQILSFKTELSRERVLEFANILGGDPSFWDKIIEEDMAEKTDKEFSGGLCTVFRKENGEPLPVRHVDYREDPKAAAQYMAAMLTALLEQGYTPEG